MGRKQGRRSISEGAKKQWETTNGKEWSWEIWMGADLLFRRLSSLLKRKPLPRRPPGLSRSTSTGVSSLITSSTFPTRSSSTWVTSVGWSEEWR